MSDFTDKLTKEALRHLEASAATAAPADFSFATHTQMLKAQLLEIAQWYAPGESLTALDAYSSLSMIIQRIAAHPSTTPVQMALICRALTDFIERAP